MQPEPDSLPCAHRSRARDEPLLGTAGFVDVWVLVECDARSARELRALLPRPYLQRNLEAMQRRQETGRGTCSRTLAIRPLAPRRLARAPVSVTLAVPRHGALYRREIAGLDGLLGLDLDAYAAGNPALDGERQTGSILAVCTDGKVDPCCAREGMAVVRALQAIAGDRVRRVSHLGGCRFASNLVALPAGVLYGRVEPRDAEELVRATEIGHIVPRLYRGRATLSAEDNAAETVLREERNEWRLDAFRLVRKEELGDGCFESVFRDGSTRSHRVRMRRTAGPPDRLTCRAEGPLAPSRYERLEIDPGPRPDVD